MVFCVNEAHVRLSAFRSVYLVTIFLCKSLSVYSFLVQMSLALGIWGMGEGLKKFKILQLN